MCRRDSGRQLLGDLELGDGDCGRFVLSAQAVYSFCARPVSPVTVSEKRRNEWNWIGNKPGVKIGRRFELQVSRYSGPSGEQRAVVWKSL